MFGYLGPLPCLPGWDQDRWQITGSLTVYLFMHLCVCVLTKVTGIFSLISFYVSEPGCCYGCCYCYVCFPLNAKWTKKKKRSHPCCTQFGWFPVSPCWGAGWFSKSALALPESPSPWPRWTPPTPAALQRYAVKLMYVTNTSILFMTQRYRQHH